MSFECMIDDYDTFSMLPEGDYLFEVYSLEEQEVFKQIGIVGQYKVLQPSELAGTCHAENFLINCATEDGQNFNKNRLKRFIAEVGGVPKGTVGGTKDVLYKKFWGTIKHKQSKGKNGIVYTNAEIVSRTPFIEDSENNTGVKLPESHLKSKAAASMPLDDGVPF